MGEHDGHRQRIIQKLDSNTLLEHEELEILLFTALPRKNTNDIAHRLLREFGSVPAVLSASVAQLSRVEGVGANVAAFLSVVGKFCKRYYSKEAHPYQGKFETTQFIPYIKNAYADEKQEIADVYLLDKAGRIFLQKRFTGDNMFNVSVLPDEFARLLLDNSPSGVVLVHNHPKGEAVPSETDDRTTNQCQMLCSCHNILFCDHLIYAPNGVYSYYLSGKMKNVSAEFSVRALLKKGKGGWQV